MTRDYYKILLVGSSGKGKTYSFRNLDPNTTGFINIEDKPLPFPNKFKYHSRPKNTVEVKKALKEYAENAEIKCICVDSFSAYVDLLLQECRLSKKGFDIWNLYNEEIGKLFAFIKSIEKEVFITTHYEILGIEGNMEKRAKVKGKEWEGVIEKEFTIVLYSDSKINDKGVPEYFYHSFLEGTSAKCPPGILGEGVFKIENDVNIILDKIKEFIK
ncbi:MAG TPA: AAA family ATPase [Tissierellaceae bacterium]